MGVLTEIGINGRASAFRRRLEVAFGRLRAEGLPILQTAVAAGVAWYLATLVLGHERPFFAAMAAAVLLGGGSLLVTEAAVSGLLVVTLDPTTQGLSPDRFLDALMGSGVALAISALFPNDPRRMVGRAVQPIFDELIVMLGETTAALHTDDLELAEQALEKARILDARVGVLKEALAAGYGTARLSPPRRRDLGYLAHYAAAADQLDFAVRNTRVLARAAVNMLQEGKHAPEQLPEA